MTILVTGGSGLVGAHLLWALLKRSDKVVALRRQSTDLSSLHAIFDYYDRQHAQTQLAKIEWRYADLCDKTALAKVMIDIDEIYHCAASVSFIADPNIMDNNIQSTRNIVEIALQQHISKFCFVSSIAACGQSKDSGLVDESIPWQDTPSKTQYAKSKYYSEQEVWKGIGQGLPAVIVCPGMILGYSGESSKHAKLFLRAKKGLPFYIAGGTGHIDVKDVAKAMIQLMAENLFNQRFILIAENLANRTYITWMAEGFGQIAPKFALPKFILVSIGFIFEIGAKLLGKRIIFDRSTARSISGQRFFSNEKIKKAINITFTPVKQSISEICAAYQRKS